MLKTSRTNRCFRLLQRDSTQPRFDHFKSWCHRIIYHHPVNCQFDLVDRSVFCSFEVFRRGIEYSKLATIEGFMLIIICQSRPVRRKTGEMMASNEVSRERYRKFDSQHLPCRSPTELPIDYHVSRDLRSRLQEMPSDVSMHPTGLRCVCLSATFPLH